MNRKIGLDIVRATAICLVLLSHFAKQLDFLGTYGVDLFFALSGFLIGGILQRNLANCNDWSFSEVKIFWARRWWRTLPNYFLFFAVSLIFHYFSGGLPSLVGLAPFLVFSQNLLNANSPFYIASWSLCIEEWFYFLFPLGILLFCMNRCSKKTALIGTTLIFLILPPILREYLFTSSDPTAIRRMTLPRLDAIFYGVAFAFLMARHQALTTKRRSLLAIGALALVGIGCLQFYSIRNGLPVLFYRVEFICVPLSFGLMLPYFAGLEALPSQFAFLNRPITNLSLWSYSIYLSHISILFGVYALFGQTRTNPLVNLLSKAVGLWICLAISKFVYERFELKFMALRPHDVQKAQPASRPK